MAYSYVDYPGMAAGQTKSIPFPYAAPSHIHVYVDGVEVSSSLFEILDDTQLVTKAGFPSGAGRIRRRTPMDAYTSIQNGTSALDWEGMTANFELTQFILQESLDAEDSRDAKVVGMDALIADVAADVALSLSQGQDTLAAAMVALTSAQEAAAAASESAASAAQFDPSTYYTRSETDAEFYSKGQSDDKFYTKAAVDALLVTALPSGFVQAFAGGTVPTGWLKANGAAVSRSAYSSLFNAIGTTYGAGDGSTTFNLPDLRAEFIRGLDDSRGIDLGRLLGSSQSSQNQAHSHTGTALSAGAHNHDVQQAAGNYLSGTNRGFRPQDSNLGVYTSTSTDGAHTHSLSINSSGGNEARPRNVALLFCIKY